MGLQEPRVSMVSKMATKVMWIAVGLVPRAVWTEPAVRQQTVKAIFAVNPFALKAPAMTTLKTGRSPISIVVDHAYHVLTDWGVLRLLTAAPRHVGTMFASRQAVKTASKMEKRPARIAVDSANHAMPAKTRTTAMETLSALSANAVHYAQMGRSAKPTLTA